MVNLFLLLACGAPGTTPDPVAEPTDDEVVTPSDPEAESPEAEAEVPRIDALSLLIRASLDLRGVRPSVEELERVEADPSLVDGLIDSYLQDSRFGERVRNLYAPLYQTRLDHFSVYAYQYGLSDEAAFAEAVGDEPLRILSTVAEQDLPYTELVTGDWTVANETLAEAWDLDYPEGATGWQVSRYTDGRPAAGVLASNGFWWRYLSTFSNANRGRANALSKTFLCTDYLSKPISFDRNVNLLDGDAVNDALKSNSGCAACHHSLDPLASYLWGFYYYDYYSRGDITVFHAEREHMWQTATEVAPGYYGDPGYTLNDLGQQVAADSRFVECAVKQAYELFSGETSDLDDTQALIDLREVFLADGLTLRGLYRAVIDTDAYQQADPDTGRPLYRKLSSPDLLATEIEDLTGFRFTYAGYDMMTTDTYGLRTLAGGVDGNFVTSPAKEPNATQVLVTERLAQAAAWYVVAQEKADPESARIFTEVRFLETIASDRDAIVAQIQRLHFVLYGKRVAADGQEVAANLDLWQDLYSIDGSIEDAWAGLLSVLLRDPDFLFY